jgi:pimeloyl-ACP methyl ester carboxylesterase
MGGVISTLYAGSFPERVSRLANLEGLGPPDNPFEVGPIRVRTWINDLRKAKRTDPTPMPKKEAHRRLQLNHPGVPHDVLAHRLPHLVREVDEENVVWLADSLHRTTAPVPFFTNLFVEFIKQITCPVLFVSGGERGFHPPDEDRRLAAFQNLEHVVLEDAGHMIHWTKPAELSALLVRFLT